MMMIVMMKIVSVEQRPGWAEDFFEAIGDSDAPCQCGAKTGRKPRQGRMHDIYKYVFFKYAFDDVIICSLSCGFILFV